MTTPEDDRAKRSTGKSDPLAAQYEWLKPGETADIGGELLFDEYGDDPTGLNDLFSRPGKDQATGHSTAPATTSLHADSGSPSALEKQSPHSIDFDEDIEDLIVFSDGEDDEDFEFDDEENDEENDEEDQAETSLSEVEKSPVVTALRKDRDEEEEEDEDEDFDDEDDEDDEDDDDDFEDEDDDDEDDEDDEEEEDEDDDLIFDDEERSATKRLTAGHARAESPPPRPVPDTHKPPGGRREDVPRRDSGSRQPRGKSPEAAESDDAYWKELDEWVWDEADSAAGQDIAAADEEEEDEDSGDDTQVRSQTDADSGRGAAEDRSGSGGRGRRRGGRGRGRRRSSDGSEGSDSGRESRHRGGPAQVRDGRGDERFERIPAADAADKGADEDLTDIVFDEEDVVSISVSSPRAPRPSRADIPAAAAEKADVDDEPVDVESSGEDAEGEADGDAGGARRSRGRRGRRGRGRTRGREESDRPAGEAPVRRRPDDEAEDRFADEPVNAAGRSGEIDLEREKDDQEEESDGSTLRRGRRRRGSAPSRPVEASGSDTERARDVPRGPSGRPADRPRTESVAPRGRRDEERDATRAPREDSAARSRVAAEFADIPTWEEAIGFLEIKSPTDSESQRAGYRGGRGGRSSGGNAGRGGDSRGGDRGPRPPRR